MFKISLTQNVDDDNKTKTSQQKYMFLIFGFFLYFS